MAQFQSYEEGIEVNGQTIMSVIAGVGIFSGLARRLLVEAGLPAEIVADAKHWYSQQRWLDAFQLIAERVGLTTLYAIGRKIPENAQFPAGMDSLETALASIDVAYHMNHRNARGEVLYDPSRPAGRVMLEGIGHYHFKRIAGENRVIMTCDNPYPCDFDRGIVTAMAHRFDRAALIRHDEQAPCRKRGADSCTYQVVW